MINEGAKDIQNLREKKHNFLMKLISEYRNTKEQQQYIARLKRNTEQQIGLRFVKSAANRNFIFPVKFQPDQEEIEQFPMKLSFESNVYDLKDQNIKQIFKKQIKVYQIKAEDISSARRVKSLSQRVSTQKIHLFKKSNKNHQVASLKHIKRYEPDLFKKKEEKLILPSLKKEKVVCKTQEIETIKKINNLKPMRREDESKLQRIFSKKLMTEGMEVQRHHFRNMHWPQ